MTSPTSSAQPMTQEETIASIGHYNYGWHDSDAAGASARRGLSEEDARAYIVSGFADNVSKELPLEYAVEMNNLIRLEMKGSIG